MVTFLGAFGVKALERSLSRSSSRSWAWTAGRVRTTRATQS